ncbi:Haloalkane dehalogenase-like protein / AMP-dependent synthetase/ligase in alkane synthesis cluster [Micrococcus lylae]|uniref:Haloalkane dehalogenase-like protein / AMP-dependent synthetase/ligase in alkane synthesis cluster n=2 Tax=Micrococcus lylae TaxID=1273 RepID=A0A1R4IZY0_9MICC|nr:Haloalkane dehalogenase-like protein / AMP-dependent synthetase/ligase in alkane synthesis cluster [Micrococcus lylae]
MSIPAAAATIPPIDRMPGWDPQWSRLLTVQSPADPAGTVRTFHIADTGPALAAMGVEVHGTILAVHGNPTWSYLWRSLMRATVDQARAGGTAWRVIAPDQLDMGFSERLPHAQMPRPETMGTAGSDYRGLAARLDDLTAITDALELPGLVAAGHRLVTIGHDWGGVVSLGWAGRHAELLSGVMTLNTAVHQPEGAPIPVPLQAALAGPLLANSTVATDAFVSVTTSLASPQLSRAVRAAYHLPYTSADRRGGVGGFVADIPATAEHGSHPALQEVSAGVSALGAADVPALILWGADDPVFLDRYLDDLRDRLPAARVHRYEEAGHLLIEDRDLTGPVLTWLELLDTGMLSSPGSGLPVSLPEPELRYEAHPSTTSLHLEDLESHVSAGEEDDDGTAPSGQDVPAAPVQPTSPSSGRRRLWDQLEEWGAPEAYNRDATALVDMTGAASSRAIVRRKRRPVAVSWGELQEMVSAIATGLWAAGVRPGDRVSMLVPPGRDLTAALYAVLRLGAVAVVADQGLGIKGMTRAMKSARPKWIIGQTPGLTLARAQSWPGTRFSVATLGAAQRSLLNVEDSLYAMVERHRDPHRVGPVDEQGQILPVPEEHQEAAVLFTSGSTGPAKGVVYTHGRLGHLVRRIRRTLGIEPGSSLLAGFAPFALLGPALGATSVSPDMDVTKPATLTARGLAEAAEAGQSTVLFASPAALRNVVATADELDEAGHAVLDRIRLVLSAGAPVPPSLMRQVTALVPNAQVHSPYGMTEGLLLTDIDADTVQELVHAKDAGVCVGTPIETVEVAIAPLLEDGSAEEVILDRESGWGVLGEVVVSAPHLKERYDALWYTDQQSKRDSLFGGGGRVWHRTNDVGHVDAEGRLWIEGRLQHVMSTPHGPVAPVGPEAAIDALGPVDRCAVVGVGPAGTQALVVCVEAAKPATRPEKRAGHLRDGRPKPGLAPAELATQVRAAVAPLAVSAVLVTEAIPTDIRHNSKIDRARMARWAEHVLAGGKVGRP